MLPINLVASAIAPFFPLALEIDYGVAAPGGPADGKGYHLQIVITIAPGKTGVDHTIETNLPIFVSPPGPSFLRDLDSVLVQMKKWSFFRRGKALVIIGYDGSPVTKVEVRSNGPKPTVRWIPYPGSMK